MNDQQFKILCRAYWHDCEFYGDPGWWYCYIDDVCKLMWEIGYEKIFGFVGEYPDEKEIHGKPEEVVKAVYDDMQRRNDDQEGKEICNQNA